MRRYTNETQPDWTITLRWDSTSKVWRSMLQDRQGNVVERETLDTTAQVTRDDARRLLRAVGDELAMFLPF